MKNEKIIKALSIIFPSIAGVNIALPTQAFVGFAEFGAQTDLFVGVSTNVTNALTITPLNIEEEIGTCIPTMEGSGIVEQCVSPAVTLGVSDENDEVGFRLITGPVEGQAGITPGLAAARSFTTKPVGFTVENSSTSNQTLSITSTFFVFLETTATGSATAQASYEITPGGFLSTVLGDVPEKDTIKSPPDASGGMLFDIPSFNFPIDRGETLDFIVSASIVAGRAEVRTPESSNILSVLIFFSVIGINSRRNLLFMPNSKKK